MKPKLSDIHIQQIKDWTSENASDFDFGIPMNRY